jgi:fructan beta-fructosidase
VEYGPDEFAGVTYSNTGNRRIFLGWMSIWQYAQQVPTERWRSAMTIPRELSIEKIGDKYLLVSKPVSEFNTLVSKVVQLKGITSKDFDLTAKTGKLSVPCKLKINLSATENFCITLSNSLNQKLVIGFDKSKDEFFIDRTQSGKVDFEKGFAKRHVAPRFLQSQHFDVDLIIDKASVELFADNGLTIMTEIFFPNEDYSNVRIQSKEKLNIKNLELSKLRSIYENKTVAIQ